MSFCSYLINKETDPCKELPTHCFESHFFVKDLVDE